MNFVGKRLEALKDRLTLNWGELAERIGMSRAMMDFIRFGTREPSPKLLRKIEAVEIEVGLRPKLDTVGHVTDGKNKGDSSKNAPRESSPVSGTPGLPTNGKDHPPDFQSLEADVAELKTMMSEVLKLLKEKKR